MLLSSVNDRVGSAGNYIISVLNQRPYQSISLCVQLQGEFPLDVTVSHPRDLLVMWVSSYQTGFPLAKLCTCMGAPMINIFFNSYGLGEVL